MSSKVSTVISDTFAFPPHHGESPKPASHGNSLQAALSSSTSGSPIRNCLML